MEKQAHDLFKESVQQRARILASNLKAKDLEEPSDVKIRERHAKKVEVTAETILKNVEGTSEAGVLQLRYYSRSYP